jgi:uncharacterized protein YprB with RNaseH-like and TPR domain
MIQRSFVHLPGIGASTEAKLWQKGIGDWAGLRRAAPELFDEKKRESMFQLLDRCEDAYRRNDLFYFYQAFPREHLWRLVPEAFDRIAYLDIETTGRGFPPAAHSTTITFYFRGEVFQEYDPVRKYRLIRKILQESSMLCTFFGEAFDVPFLRAEFPDLDFDKAHIDLCFWLKRQGYKGGLKKVQKEFKDIPARDSLDINGFDAVRLWSMHRRGVPGALETLLTYNAEDTVVLEPLLIKAYNREIEAMPVPGLIPLEPRAFPELGTRIDPRVYEMLRGVGAD